MSRAGLSTAAAADGRSAAAAAADPPARALAWTDGCVRLWRFGALPARRPPVLLVPSLLHRWTVFDLVPHASLAATLAAASLDVFALDWGPCDRDRRFGLDEALARLRRARRAAQRLAAAPRAALVGYSQGATLAAIDAASSPDEVAALATLAGPIDFAQGGLMAWLTDRRLCDADAIADAGGPAAGLFRPVAAAMASPARDALAALPCGAPADRDTWLALDAWSAEVVPLAAELFRAWVKSFYQDNALVAGHLRALGAPVDLARITAPVLVAVGAHDAVCPPASALALHVATPRAASHETLALPGGHLSAIAGPAAPALLHRPLAAWLARQLGATAA